MKIKDVRTWAVENPPPHYGGPFWVFVKLTTDNGIAGYGEAYCVPFSASRVRSLIEDVAERLVIGRSPFEIETLWRLMYSSGFSQHPEMTMGGVMSAIEIACWDIVGKALDQPVYNLLGGEGPTVGAEPAFGASPHDCDRVGGSGLEAARWLEPVHADFVIIWFLGR